MGSVFKILLIIFLILFVVTLLGALIQGIRTKNQSSKRFGLSALIMAILAVGSFWGASAASHGNQNSASSSQSTTKSSSSTDTSSSASNETDSKTSSSSSASSHSHSKKTTEQQKAKASSASSQRKQNQRDQQFEASDMRRRDMENRRQERMFAKRGTDKKGYEKKIKGIPAQSSHVVEKVTYQDGKTVAIISSDLTMGNRRENEHNAFTVWNGIKRLAFLYRVKTNVIIKDHKGKEIANTNNNRFNYLE
ncbi:hypothetical protein [Lactobacillus sp. Sy-1]|uniref:hypothetical protein n=1 Tax=Lactobacillus sp. Sy-1 TaxID=2109645 RepID=UPI001C5BC2B2|nr:hypothetical protein [Lactobacillus sp. Sy-1]MBW1605918.1 hypothetical protein [Lactobacillus sp. Sy-1]